MQETSPQKEPAPVTRSVSRAVGILQAFDEERSELGVTELAQLTDLDKATVYRMLNALQQGGMIEQNPETTKYHLGFGVVRLAGLALRHLSLPGIARPHLRKLVSTSQETVNLSVMTDEGKMINIDGITSPRMVRNVGWIGREMPAHTVSGGKVMLAYLPDGRMDQILAHELKSATPQTITSPAELRQELGWIRKRGYGMAEGELEEGLSAVAAPIWNHEGQVVAIISISGPSFRLPRERLIELGRVTRTTAEAISRQLGYVA